MQIIGKIIIMLIMVALYDVFNKLIKRFIKDIRKVERNKENDKE